MTFVDTFYLEIEYTKDHLIHLKIVIDYISITSLKRIRFAGNFEIDLRFRLLHYCCSVSTSCARAEPVLFPNKGTKIFDIFRLTQNHKIIIISVVGSP